MSAPELLVFFDGACPLCRKDVAMMRWLDRRRRIQWTDIAAPNFSAAAYGTRMDVLMAELHVRLPDASFRTGADAFREIYRALGLGALVWLTMLPGLRWVVDQSYRVFAKNRLRLTGRCTPDGHCALTPSNPAG